MQELGKYLVVLGIVIVVMGAFLWSGKSFPTWLGNLPGDISYKSENGSFYFPIATCILVSLLLTAISWISRYFAR